MILRTVSARMDRSTNGSRILLYVIDLPPTQAHSIHPIGS